MECMKPLLLAATLALLAASRLSASPYNISFDEAYAYHWDEVLFTYKPGAGWDNGFIWTGNNAEADGRIIVTRNDGSSGKYVTLKVTFEFQYWSGFSRDAPIDRQDQLNFAGFDSAKILGSYGGPQDFGTSGIVRFSYITPWEYNNDPFSENNIWYQAMMSHVQFLPVGLKVHDASTGAAFSVEMDTVLFMRNVEVVPEPINIAALMTVGFFCLALVRRPS
jgi:hypothetical protein